jgi:hypothetical protein
LRRFTSRDHLSDMNPNRRPTLILCVLLVSTAIATPSLTAQARPGAQAETPEGWAPPSFGIRGGYDNRKQRNLVGAQARLPVLPGGQVELMPSMDVTFLLLGVKDYQYNIEAVYVFGGRAGGFYGGGGLGIRNSLFGDAQVRSTKLGYTAVVGIRLVGLGLVVPQVEYRAVFISAAPISYQQLTLGVNIALWRPVRSR